MRLLLVYFSAVLPIVFTHVIVSAAESNTKPPQLNVLYIMTDDHAAPALGVYKSRLAKLNPTPNLDQLASEGLVFNNTFVANSICTPSRATILTGQYSQTNQVLDLAGSLPKERQYLPQELSKAGYQTAIIGKWHLQKEPAAFDYYKVLPVQGKYFDPDFRIRGKRSWPNNLVQHKGHSSDVIASESVGWLQARKDKRPFFLMMQFKAPHDYFEYAPRYRNYLKNVKVPEPADLYRQSASFGSIATRGKNDRLRGVIGTSVSKRNKRRNYGTIFGFDQGLADKEYTHRAYQKYLKDYLRCVRGIDDNIAKVVQYLKQSGLYENTIIIYTSDQGMMLGEHDYIDKRWMYDESMRMPLIVRHPFASVKSGLNNTLINNTDFAPTILDMVGVRVPAKMHGRSFAPIFTGGELKDWRTATYYRYWMHRAHHDVPAHFGLRSKRYKLIFFYGVHYETQAPDFYEPDFKLASGKTPVEESTPPGWELYDLEKDPTETNNVYGQPQYAKVTRELKAELLAQRQKYNETDNSYPHIQKIINKHWND